MTHDSAPTTTSTQNAHQPRRARPSWWRSNRLWLLAMPVLLVLALLASAQRLVSVYLPWDQTRPLSAADNMVHYQQRYKQIDEWFEREDAARLRRRIRRLLATIDPDLLRQRAERARSATGLRRWVDEPGVDTWLGTFPARRRAGRGRRSTRSRWAGGWR